MIEKKDLKPGDKLTAPHYGQNEAVILEVGKKKILIRHTVTREYEIEDLRLWVKR